MCRNKISSLIELLEQNYTVEELNEFEEVIYEKNLSPVDAYSYLCNRVVEEGHIGIYEAIYDYLEEKRR